MAFKFEERDYQKLALKRVLEAFDRGRESVLIESPVGSGKTVMGLMAVRALQDRDPELKVSWVATRKHILEQTRRINDTYFHCTLQYVSAFASNPPQADLVVVDEAHHEATQSVVNIYERSGNKRTLGLSATPLRTDKMRLSFQTTVRTCNIQELIHRGVLSPFHSYICQNWDPKFIARVYLENQERWGKSLVFFRTVKDCLLFRNELRKAGISCEVVTGSSDRERQLEDFIKGRIQVMANVSVLTEGFDVPEIKSVFIRDGSRLPTIQMAGRGLRRAEGKEYCNLIQSGSTRWFADRIAEPRKNFRYSDGVWLSCDGNTQVILDAVDRTKALIREAQKNKNLIRYKLNDTPEKLEVKLSA